MSLTLTRPLLFKLNQTILFAAASNSKKTKGSTKKASSSKSPSYSASTSAASSKQPTTPSPEKTTTPKQSSNDRTVVQGGTTYRFAPANTEGNASLYKTLKVPQFPLPLKPIPEVIDPDMDFRIKNDLL